MRGIFIARWLCKGMVFAVIPVLIIADMICVAILFLSGIKATDPWKGTKLWWGIIKGL